MYAVLTLDARLRSSNPVWENPAMCLIRGNGHFGICEKTTLSECFTAGGTPCPCKTQRPRHPRARDLRGLRLNHRPCPCVRGVAPSS